MVGILIHEVFLWKRGAGSSRQFLPTYSDEDQVFDLGIEGMALFIAHAGKPRAVIFSGDRQDDPDFGLRGVWGSFLADPVGAVGPMDVRGATAGQSNRDCHRLRERCHNPCILPPESIVGHHGSVDSWWIQPNRGPVIQVGHPASDPVCAVPSSAGVQSSEV
jgi:hypothetical protein